MEEKRDMVWEKAKVVDGYTPDLIRQDCCGAWIMYEDYGNRDSDFGWEIDHVYPLASGGGDDNDNLRAMQWENNISKGNDYPSYHVVKIADGGVNVDVDNVYTVNKSLRDKLADLYGAQG